MAASRIYSAFIGKRLGSAGLLSGTLSMARILLLEFMDRILLCHELSHVGFILAFRRKYALLRFWIFWDALFLVVFLDSPMGELFLIRNARAAPASETTSWDAARYFTAAIG